MDQVLDFGPLGLILVGRDILLGEGVEFEGVVVAV